MPLQTEDQLFELALRHHQAGQLQQAGELYRQILQSNPDQPDALNLLGTVYHQTGNNDWATEYIGRAIDIAPDNPYFLDNLGTVYQALTRLDDAAICYRKVIALDPSFAGAHFNLGNVLLGQGRPDNAVACFQNALALRPDYVDAYICLGNAYKNLAKLDEAVECYQKALSYNSNYAEVHFNLGIVFHEQGKLDMATVSYHNALSLKPNYAEAHYNLGIVFQERDDLDDAVECYHQAIALKPDYIEAYFNLGGTFQEQGKLDEAVECLHKALSLRPDYADAYAGLASIYADLGEFGAAQVAIARALEIQPESPIALAVFPSLQRMSAGNAGWLSIALNITSQTGSPLSVQDATGMQFAIGKYFDDTGQYDLAFAAYRQGNMLKRQREGELDHAGFTQMVDALIAAYSREGASKSQQGASLSERPILIVGMPRSGTSLIEQIIASHPDAIGAGELFFWDTQARANWEAVISGHYAPGMLAGIADAYEQLLQQHSPVALRIIDKMPHNFIRLGLIGAAFPQAKIIHAQRNPVDTCLSIYFQNLGRYHSYGTDLDDLAFYYREYTRIMRHWRTVFPPERFLEVPYEALVDDQETWSKRMIEFVGLKWDERCLDFHKTERKVGTSSNWQVKQKIYSTSKARWRNYEKHLAPLLGLLNLDEPSP